jgi:diguanylate cyclase (GGDEF)-like protein
MQARQDLSATWAAAQEIESMLEVRSSDDLAAWLAHRLGTRFPMAQRRILRVYPGKAARVKGSGSHEAYSILDPSLQDPPVPVGLDVPMVEAIRARVPLTITGAGRLSRLLAALSCGGEVRYLVELTGDFAGVNTVALSEFMAIVAKYYERLGEAETDPLTRLWNRRVFQNHVEMGVKRWIASGREHYFAVLDIDHFKRVNDSFGHLYGDEILVHFANFMRKTFRAGDLLYRFGGEEFVVVYGVERGRGGELPLERFRAAVEANDFPKVGRVTVSSGFTRIADAATPIATLIDRADQALYYSKAHGRNRVASWDALVATGELKPVAHAKDVTLF